MDTENEERTGVIEIGRDGAIKVVSSEINSNSHQVYMTYTANGQCSMLMVPKSGDTSQAFIVKPTDGVNFVNQQFVPPVYPGTANTVRQMLSNRKNDLPTTSNHCAMIPRTIPYVPVVTCTTSITHLASVNNNTASIAPQPCTNTNVSLSYNANNNVSNVQKSGNITFTVPPTVTTSSSVTTVVSSMPPVKIAPPQPVLQQTLPSGTRFALVPIFINPSNVSNPTLMLPNQMMYTSVPTSATPATKVSHSQIEPYITTTQQSRPVKSPQLQTGLSTSLCVTKGSVSVASQSPTVTTVGKSTTNLQLGTINAAAKARTVCTTSVISEQTEPISTRLVPAHSMPPPVLAKMIAKTTDASLPFPMLLFSHESAFKLKPSGTSATSDKAQTRTVTISTGGNKSTLTYIGTPKVTTKTTQPITCPITVSQFNNTANALSASTVTKTQTVGAVQSVFTSTPPTTIQVVTSKDTRVKPQYMIQPGLNMNTSSVKLPNTDPPASERYDMTKICYVMQDMNNTSKRILLTTNKPLASTTVSSTIPIPLAATPNVITSEKFKTSQNLASQALQKHINSSKTSEIQDSKGKRNSPRGIPTLALHNVSSGLPGRENTNDSSKSTQNISSGVLREHKTMAALNAKAHDTLHNYLDRDEPIRIESVFSPSNRPADGESTVQCESSLSKDGSESVPVPIDAYLCSKKRKVIDDINQSRNLNPCMVILPKFQTDSKRKFYNAHKMLREMRKKQRNCSNKCKRRVMYTAYHPQVHTSNVNTRMSSITTVSAKALEKETEKSAKSGELNVVATAPNQHPAQIQHANNNKYTIKSTSSGVLTSMSASLSSNHANLSKHDHLAYMRPTVEARELSKHKQSVPFLIQNNSPPTPIILQQRTPPINTQSPARMSTVSSSRGVDQNKLVTTATKVNQPATTNIVTNQSANTLLSNASSSSEVKATKKFYLMKSGDNTILISYSGNNNMPRGFVTDNMNAMQLMKSVATSATSVAQKKTAPVVAASARFARSTGETTHTTVSTTPTITKILNQPPKTNYMQLDKSNSVAPDTNMRIKAEPNTVGYGDEKRRTPSPPVLVKEEPIHCGYSDELVVPTGSKRAQPPRIADSNFKRNKHSFSESLMENSQSELTDTIHQHPSTHTTMSSMSVSFAAVPSQSSASPTPDRDQVDDRNVENAVFTSSVTSQGERIRKLKEKLKTQMQEVENVRRKRFDNTD